MTLEKGDHRSLEEWETVVGDDFSLYYDSYSVDERVDSDSKVGQPPSPPAPPVQGSLQAVLCSEHPHAVYNSFQSVSHQPPCC